MGAFTSNAPKVVIHQGAICSRSRMVRAKLQQFTVMFLDWSHHGQGTEIAWRAAHIGTTGTLACAYTQQPAPPCLVLKGTSQTASNGSGHL